MVITDISIIHGHPHPEIVLVPKKVIKSKTQTECASLSVYAVDRKVWLPLLVK